MTIHLLIGMERIEKFEISFIQVRIIVQRIDSLDVQKRVCILPTLYHHSNAEAIRDFKLQNNFGSNRIPLFSTSSLNRQHAEKLKTDSSSRNLISCITVISTKRLI